MSRSGHGHGRGFGFGGLFGTAELSARFGCEVGSNGGAKLFYRGSIKGELRFLELKRCLFFRGEIKEKKSSRVSFFFSRGYILISNKNI